MLDSATLHHVVGALSDLNDRQAQITGTLSSGVRLGSLADDPAGAARAVRIADSLRRDDSFLATSATASSRLQAADTALGAVVTQLGAALSTAVAAQNATLTSQQRVTNAQQLRSLRDSIVSLANSSYDGAYLFSGTGSATPFVQTADGSVGYTGTASTASVQLAGGGSLPTSLAGSGLFLDGSTSVFGALNDAISALDQDASPEVQASSVIALRSALGWVSSQRSALNVSQARLTGESDNITEQKTNLKVEQSRLLSPDTAQLATELSAVTAQRSALLSTIAIVQKGSLFDYL